MTAPESIRSTRLRSLRMTSPQGASIASGVERTPPRRLITLLFLLLLIAARPTTQAQNPTPTYTTEAASLRAIQRPGGGLYWVEQRPDDTYAVRAEDFSLVATFPVAEDSLAGGTTVRALGEDFRVDATQPNFLVERTGEFVLQLLYAADGTLLRRTTWPRYTTTYRLTDGRLVVQQRDGDTGEEVLLDLQTLAELGRFPERVVHTAVTGSDLWASRAPLAARVYDDAFVARSEVAVVPARADSTPGFAFGLLDVDLAADGLLDFEIRYAAGAGQEDEEVRYRVFDEAGHVYLDTLEPAGTTLAVAPGLDPGDAGSALLIGYGLGQSFAFGAAGVSRPSVLSTTAPRAVRTAAGTFVAGPRSRGAGVDALVYDADYAFVRLLSPGPIASAAGDTALQSFAYVVAGPGGEVYGGAPLAWVSYGDPDDLTDTRFTLTDLEGEVRFTLAAEALATAVSDTAVYLVVDAGGPPRSRAFSILSAPLPPADTGGGAPPPDTTGGNPPPDTTSGTPPPDTTGSGGDTTSTAVVGRRHEPFAFTPNPVGASTALIGDDLGPVTIELVGPTGRVIREVAGVRVGEQLPFGDLPPGIYAARLRRGDRLLGVTRLVVRSSTR